jgi:sigma-B regulation protein RsbU (phosphoserine phosphatase)
LRGQLTDIAVAAVFLFIGLSTCAIAAIRHRRGLRSLVWIGIWSATYGAMQVCQVRAVVAALPQWSRSWVPYANVSMTYLILVPAALSFLDLSLGRLRTLIFAAAGLGLAIAMAGISIFALTGSRSSLMLYNNMLAAFILAILAVVLSVPYLSAKYLALQYRGVVVAGMLTFALQALYSNLSRHLGVEPLRALDHLGFAALLFSFGYAALRMVIENERRLLAVQNELEIARRIQLATLPRAVPEVQGLRVSAAYRPMTAVAGDFYDFIRVDEHRVGILVADVAGHGVPAALIASMLKVAMPSVAHRAQDPDAVLQGLNRMFVGQSPTPLISAAYLWLDTQARTARYSAAGHPPLLRWRQGRLDRIDSNGCLIGVLAESDYPVLSLSIDPDERFLIYTDGVTEVENSRGEFFDDGRLEEVFRENQSRPPAELSDQLLREIDRWRPASVPQQDDITLVVIDVA